MDPRKSKYYQPRDMERKPFHRTTECETSAEVKVVPKNEVATLETMSKVTVYKPKFLEQLYWINRHALCAVPILNSEQVAKQMRSGKANRFIIEIAENDIEWATGATVKYRDHRVFVRREDIKKWDEAVSAIEWLLEETLKNIDPDATSS